MRRKNHSAHRGFSLVESLVAITIITSAISAPMYAVTIGLRNARGAANEVTAYYLAQEAVEGLRYLRDSATIAGEAPFARFSPPDCVGGIAGSEKKCTIDEAGLESGPAYGIAANCVLECPKLKFDGATNRYGYGSGTESIFRREIFTKETNQAPPGQIREVRIRAVVSWDDQTGTRKVEVVETLHTILVKK